MFEATSICACITTQYGLSFVQIGTLQHGELKWLVQDSTIERDAQCANMLFIVTASLCKLSKVYTKKSKNVESLITAPQIKGASEP